MFCTVVTTVNSTAGRDRHLVVAFRDKHARALGRLDGGALLHGSPEVTGNGSEAWARPKRSHLNKYGTLRKSDKTLVYDRCSKNTRITGQQQLRQLLKAPAITIGFKPPDQVIPAGGLLVGSGRRIGRAAMQSAIWECSQQTSTVPDRVMMSLASASVSCLARRLWKLNPSCPSRQVTSGMTVCSGRFDSLLGATVDA